ncbi:unnamed protein product [Linum tenue]|uniref:SHSP domain-containing protein n=1 Tax=Linum tenue TaxID=586396 RepID=A0AAV0KTN5_9ROSI|nr:unnamed protein product [Linum tenue]
MYAGPSAQPVLSCLIPCLHRYVLKKRRTAESTRAGRKQTRTRRKRREEQAIGMAVCFSLLIWPILRMGKSSPTTDGVGKTGKDISGPLAQWAVQITLSTSPHKFPQRAAPHNLLFLTFLDSSRSTKKLCPSPARNFQSFLSCSSLEMSIFLPLYTTALLPPLRLLEHLFLYKKLPTLAQSFHLCDKMSQVLSNLGLSLPSPSKSSCNSLVNLKNSGSFSIKAMAPDGRDNLDHLQRVNRNNKQQQQSRRKVSPPSAPVGLWDRFPTAKTVQQMMDTMERLVEEDPLLLAYSPPPQLSMEDLRGGYSRGRTPWEIREGESDYKMRFDMPGMTKSDVRVWVEDKMLVVRAKKSAAGKDGEVEGDKGDDWSAKSYGRYSSRIALPENVEFEKIKAEVKDGVLYISIPKAGLSSKVLDIHVE